MIMVNGEHPTVALFRHTASGTPAALAGKDRFVLNERDAKVSFEMLIPVAASTGSGEAVGGASVPMEAFRVQPGEATAALLASGLITHALILRNAQWRQRAPFSLLLVVPTAEASREMWSPAAQE